MLQFTHLNNQFLFTCSINHYSALIHHIYEHALNHTVTSSSDEDNLFVSYSLIPDKNKEVGKTLLLYQSTVVSIKLKLFGSRTVVVTLTIKIFVCFA